MSENVTLKKVKAIFPTRLLCLMEGNSSGVEFLRNRTISKFRNTAKTFRRSLFTSSTTPEIRHFLVVVVQWRKKLLFCTFRLRSHGNARISTGWKFVRLVVPFTRNHLTRTKLQTSSRSKFRMIYAKINNQTVPCEQSSQLINYHYYYKHSLNLLPY